MLLILNIISVLSIISLIIAVIILLSSLLTRNHCTFIRLAYAGIKIVIISLIVFLSASIGRIIVPVL